MRRNTQFRGLSGPWHIAGSQRKEIPVTRLRQMMIEELERRNHAYGTCGSVGGLR